jgi:hypothetical protein
MIICPSCKEEIESDSRYCDQCGIHLFYCSSCGRVGMGRHCTYCGGLMREAQDGTLPTAVSFTIPDTIPVLKMTNVQLGISIVGSNGAVIGRRQGPYRQLLEQNKYISGVHAQLIYDHKTGWCIVDKNSSNGTKLNNKQLQPECVTALRSGDTVSIATLNFLVDIS